MRGLRNLTWIVIAIICAGLIYARFTLPEFTNNVNPVATPKGK
jgi:hypothetical protein